jgi:hypothetical protein
MAIQYEWRFNTNHSTSPRRILRVDETNARDRNLSRLHSFFAERFHTATSVMIQAMTPTDDRVADAKRVAIASAVGTTIEWYDFFIYGTAAAVVFAPQFFPQASALAGTLAAFATFAIGFVARPLGGIVMGHFGDRLGRKAALVWCLVLMGLSTFAIGLLPRRCSAQPEIPGP